MKIRHYGPAHIVCSDQLLELALELGQDFSDCLCCPGGGGDDVLCCGAGASRIRVRQVRYVLVVGVGMDRCHDSMVDAEGVIENLGDWRKAVGCTGCVRERLLLGGDGVPVISGFGVDGIGQAPILRRLGMSSKVCITVPRS